MAKEHPTPETRTGWRAPIDRVVSSAPMRLAQTLGLRLSVTALLLGWLVLLVGINALYPIDVSGLFLSAVFLTLYVLPGLIAYDRGLTKRLRITVINVFFGWTLVGWAGVLFWALIGEPDPESSGIAHARP
ncbi:superinfection immunity protein [Marichromatium bheemlicum]|uniref:Superinfection immunity protein n=1 Tax=Marichromatium bheemlicum TaxID=365339 RepID=A0ABX1I6C5_9GAMM|nr:superinfection immunity protein [Marichromatium bheemlicum]NKN33114.1 superinfection immunity protein [Marichromatium bheemlicum]